MSLQSYAFFVHTAQLCIPSTIPVRRRLEWLPCQGDEDGAKNVYIDNVDLIVRFYFYEDVDNERTDKKILAAEKASRLKNLTHMGSVLRLFF